MSTKCKGEDAGHAAAVLTLWGALIILLLALAPIPPPMKSYKYMGPWHFAIIVLTPVGAWHAARYGAAKVGYLVYGALIGLLFARLVAYHGMFLPSDVEFKLRAAVLCIMPFVFGFGCRAIPAIRAKLHEVHLRDARERNVCATCEYDLTGNVSGACPECGTAVRSAQMPKRQDAENSF